MFDKKDRDRNRAGVKERKVSFMKGLKKLCVTSNIFHFVIFIVMSERFVDT